MSRELDRQVCVDLGWNDDDFAKAHNRLPKFSTEPGFVGHLLLEAQKRGWVVHLACWPSGKWEICIIDGMGVKDELGHSFEESLPEAVCLAFVAAASKEKT